MKNPKAISDLQLAVSIRHQAAHRQCLLPDSGSFIPARVRRLTAVGHSPGASPAQRAGYDVAQPSSFLLFGITGSGKTEIYLRAVAEVLQRGKQAIILVPEIALTPQTIRRFAARFPDRIAVWHSELSLDERYDTWRRVQLGEIDLVIGARSALFLPFDSPGLIVLDEEHDSSYKQSDSGSLHDQCHGDFGQRYTVVGGVEPGSARTISTADAVAAYPGARAGDSRSRRAISHCSEVISSS
jgi:hypothetical protein